MNKILKQSIAIIKEILQAGNSILNLIYFNIFYAKITPGIIEKINKLDIIDQDWSSDVPKTYEEYLDLIIYLKLKGEKTKIK